MDNIIKKYTNGAITIIWQPSLCIHSTICWKGATGLSSVFNPREKPWIKPEGADTETIRRQVEKCPSGALSYLMNEEIKENTVTSSETLVEVLPNGPLLVYGNVKVKDKEGHETTKNKVTAFCRCGQSGNKPYCDGTHIKAGFKD